MYPFFFSFVFFINITVYRTKYIVLPEATGPKFGAVSKTK